MEVLIDACSTVDELATLYKYVNTGTEEEPVMERPLGEFPEAVLCLLFFQQIQQQQQPFQ